VAANGKRREGAEQVLQRNVHQLLHRYGYVLDHTYRLRTEDGSWRTGSTWNGKPDTLAVRPPRVLAIEFKSGPQASRTNPERRQRQVASLSWWSLVPCARAWLLWPDAVPWDNLRGWIEAPGRAPATFGFEPMDQLAAFRVLATAAQRANV
jgi:hypothetical protein